MSWTKNEKLKSDKCSTAWQKLFHFWPEFEINSWLLKWWDPRNIVLANGAIKSISVLLNKELFNCMNVQDYRTWNSKNNTLNLRNFFLCASFPSLQLWSWHICRMQISFFLDWRRFLYQSCALYRIVLLSFKNHNVRKLELNIQWPIFLLQRQYSR